MGRTKAHRVTAWVGITAVLINSLLPAAALQAADWGFGSTTSIQRLAGQIDKLQRHIDKYGSIVAKDPDVWGQSRLMTHRVEFENQMKTMLNQFEFRLNAAEFTRDSAFLSQALSLQASIDGRDQVSSVPPPVIVVANDNTQIPAFPNVANPNPGTTSTGSTAFVGRTNFREGFSSTFQNEATAKMELGIEPTIELDQMRRYLNHLNEIRRLNEGDDTADSPGYALHLVRVPVSVLPGKQTHKGYGAEITMTIQPQLSEELLPNAFRDFVINGVRDRLTARVLHIADQADIKKMRLELNREYRWEPPTGQTESVSSRITPDPLTSRLYAQASPSRLPTEGQNESEQGNKGDNNQLLSIISDSQATVLRNGADSVTPTQNPFLDGPTLARIALDVFDHFAYSAKAVSDIDQLPAGERGLMFADVEHFISTELVAAYRFLMEPSAQCLWDEHCGPELARSIREFRRELPSSREDELGKRGRSADKVDSKYVLREIAARREAFFDQIELLFPEAIDSTTANLA